MGTLWHSCIVFALLLSGACAESVVAVDDDGELALAERFAGDREFRRDALEQSLVDPGNGYSRLRLRNYEIGAGAGWDALPVFDPLVRPVTADEVGLEAERGDLAVVWDGELPGTVAELRELGRVAFETFPLRPEDETKRALVSHAELERFGIWIDDRGRVGGFVRYERADGSVGTANTCSSCHGRLAADGSLVLAAANVHFDRGTITYEDAVEQGFPPRSVQQFLSWGLGQVDPTSDGIDNPTAITDLRPIRHQRHLNWAASIDNGLVALAVRVETLMITSSGETHRPPPVVAFAIAAYLWSLGEEGSAGDVMAEPAGAQLFDRNCSSCHQADGRVGPAVPVELVGTDPRVGQSSMRGTGAYRVPSLWGVYDRAQLMHDGQLSSLEEMFDPERVTRVPGHPFGLELSADERADLLRFVRTIGR